MTTGGTGFGPRDVTPEATGAVIERVAPGLVFAMLHAGLQKTPHAALSRRSGRCRRIELIVNLPGSPKAVTEGLERFCRYFRTPFRRSRGTPPTAEASHPTRWRSRSTASGRRALPSSRPTIVYLEGGSQVVEKEVERAIEALLQERRTFEPPQDSPRGEPQRCRPCTKAQRRTPTCGGSHRPSASTGSSGGTPSSSAIPPSQVVRRRQAQRRP